MGPGGPRRCRLVLGWGEGCPTFRGSAPWGCGGRGGWWYGSSGCPRWGWAQGGPFGVDVVAGRIRFLVWGGRPLLVGGVVGWSARWVVLPSHALVLLVHGGLRPCGLLGTSSHRELRTLAIVLDAINDTHQQPRDYTHNVRVVVDEAVDFQIVRKLA